MEWLGRWLGRAVAPLFAAGSALRQARVFHPVGVFYAAEVVPLHPSASRLAGSAVLRFSGAIWRKERAPDLLGLAIRFRQGRPLNPDPDPADQDLVLGTFRHLLDLGPALLRADPHDFLGNVYHGGAPFWVPELGRVWLHVQARAPSPPGPDRDQRLLRAIEAGRAELRLLATEQASLREGRDPVPLARLKIGARLALTDRQTGFHPFRAGAGIEPRGFVQAMRQIVYPASQRARGYRGPQPHR